VVEMLVRFDDKASPVSDFDIEKVYLKALKDGEAHICNAILLDRFRVD
jgi:hypothetical protein